MLPSRPATFLPAVRGKTVKPRTLRRSLHESGKRTALIAAAASTSIFEPVSVLPLARQRVRFPNTARLQWTRLTGGGLYISVRLPAFSLAFIFLTKINPHSLLPLPPPPPLPPSPPLNFLFSPARIRE